MEAGIRMSWYEEENIKNVLKRLVLSLSVLEVIKDRKLVYVVG